VIGGGLAIGAAGYLVIRASRHTEDWRATLMHSRAPLYASAATAAAAFAVGGYFLHLDGRSTCGVLGDCFFRYRTAPYGWAVIATGVAASGFGVYWQLRARDDSPARTMSIVPTAGGAIAGIAASF
jgi:hypothetical protein